jgi:hypothetical protein
LISKEAEMAKQIKGRKILHKNEDEENQKIKQDFYEDYNIRRLVKLNIS